MQTVDRRPSLGHGRTTPTALIHPANLLQEVALHRPRWRATLRALFPRKINNLSRPRSWPKLGRRSTANLLQSGQLAADAVVATVLCDTGLKYWLVPEDGT